ncbi:MAG: hypothetical protein AAFO91_11175, partial [Bacteroidota bacterium]
DANPENPVSNPGPVSTENPIAVPLAQNESTPDSEVDDGQLAESSPLSFANQLEEQSFADNGQRQTVSSPSVIESVDQSALIPDQPTPVTLSSPPSAAESLRDLAASAQALGEEVARTNAQLAHVSPNLMWNMPTRLPYPGDFNESLMSDEETTTTEIERYLVDRQIDYQPLEELSIKPVRIQNRFELELSLGPAYANQILKASSEVFRPDLDAREVSEFPHLSYSGVARLRYRLRNGFSVSGGIGYTALRNRLEYEMPRQGEDALLVESTNSSSLMELPIMLGYELPGEKVKLGISAGPVINLLSSANGSYLSSESMMPIEFNEAGVYNSTAGIAWRINLSTSYPIGQSGTRLLVEPTFSHYPKSFTSDAYPISERYWMAGLQLGIRKLLK